MSGLCPICGRQHGACVHTTEGQVTERPMSRAMAALLGHSASWPRLSSTDVADEYVAQAGTIGQDNSANPTRPQCAAACQPPATAVAAAAGGADLTPLYVYLAVDALNKASEGLRDGFQHPIDGTRITDPVALIHYARGVIRIALEHLGKVQL